MNAALLLAAVASTPGDFAAVAVVFGVLVVLHLFRSWKVAVFLGVAAIVIGLLYGAIQNASAVTGR